MILEDTFGRRFSYLRLSVTEICNFRCDYCLPDGNPCNTPKKGLSLDEIQTLVTAFAKLGTTKIRLTGGEPSLRKDLIEIIAICKNTPGIEQVTMTTNGFRLSKDAFDYATAGLDSINVSADSLDPRLFASITGHDKLEEVLAGIDKALEAGLYPVKINSVLLKQSNSNDHAAVLDYLKTHSVTWRFIELMQTGTNLAYFKQNHVSANNLKQTLLEKGWQRVLRATNAGPAQEFAHPDYAGKFGVIMPYSKDFCASCNRLRISSQGKLHLCLFAEQGLDIRPWLTAGDVSGTCETLIALMEDKKRSHALLEGNTGATQQLAMLGG